MRSLGFAESLKPSSNSNRTPAKLDKSFKPCYSFLLYSHSFSFSHIYILSLVRLFFFSLRPFNCSPSSVSFPSNYSSSQLCLNYLQAVSILVLHPLLLLIMAPIWIIDKSVVMAFNLIYKPAGRQAWALYLMIILMRMVPSILFSLSVVSPRYRNH